MVERKKGRRGGREKGGSRGREREVERGKEIKGEEKAGERGKEIKGREKAGEESGTQEEGGRGKKWDGKVIGQGGEGIAVP